MNIYRDRSHTSLSRPSKKLYQSWSGRNVFFCKGRVISGPGYYWGILTFLFLNFYFTLSVISLTTQFDTSFKHFLIVLKLVVGAAHDWFLLVTIFSNPGILPKAPALAGAFYNVSVEQAATKFQVIKGRLFNVKYCVTCKIFRPPGASHCKRCNRCVEKYDHHCPWVGNCIGRDNYKYFFFFISLLNFLVLAIVSESIYFLVALNSDQGDYSPSVNTDYWALIVLILSILCMIFVTTLHYFHIKFIAYNLTTYASTKMNTIVFMYGNPFSHNSIWKNIKAVLCLKRKSLMDFQSVSPPVRSKIINTINSSLLGRSKQRRQISEMKVNSFKSESDNESRSLVKRNLKRALNLDKQARKLFLRKS